MLLFPDEPFVGLGQLPQRRHQQLLQRSRCRTRCSSPLLAAPLVVIIGTLIALFLQRHFFGSQVVRSVVLLPWVLPGAISAVLWIWVFHPSFGVLNGAAARSRPDRRLDPLADHRRSSRCVSVIVAHVWTQIPFAVVLMMAALSAINPETLEAAAIDCRSAHEALPPRRLPRDQVDDRRAARLQRADRLHELRPRLCDDRRRARHGDDAASPSRSGGRASRCTISAPARPSPSSSSPSPRC